MVVNEVDVLLVTGDLTVTGADAEYPAAADLLRSCGVARVLAVPGNHDLASEDAVLEDRFYRSLGWTCPGGRCPWVWESESARIVGLNSSGYTGSPTDHHGEVGILVAEWLERSLRTWQDDRTTVVALHHDVLPPLGTTPSPTALAHACSCATPLG